MKITKTAIIKAAPEHVYDAITDFAAYPHWNPCLVKAEGLCQEGADVVVDARVGGKISQYHHCILTVDRPRVFHWCDVGWFTVLADGNRKRTLDPHPEGTHYQVELDVSGPLEFLVRWLFGSSLEEGMDRETQALKAYVEGRHEN